MTPVDPAFGAHRRTPPLELLRELGMHREAVGPGEELFVERYEKLARARRLYRLPSDHRLFVWLFTMRNFAEPSLELLLDLDEPLIRLVHLPLGVLTAQHARRRKRVGIARPHRRMILDPLVHQR